jgi:hypothetical protein
MNAVNVCGHCELLLTYVGQQDLIAASESISSEDFLEDNWPSKEVEEKLNDLSHPLYTLFHALRDLSIDRHGKLIEFPTEKERLEIAIAPSQISLNESLAPKLVDAPWDTRDHLQTIQRSLTQQLYHKDVPIPWLSDRKISLGREFSMWNLLPAADVNNYKLSFQCRLPDNESMRLDRVAVILDTAFVLQTHDGKRWIRQETALGFEVCLY